MAKVIITLEDSETTPGKISANIEFEPIPDPEENFTEAQKIGLAIAYELDKHDKKPDID